MEYEYVLEDRKSQPTVAIRTRSAAGDLPQVIGQAYAALAAYLAEAGVEPAFAPYVGYFNMDMQDLDIEIGFPVAQELPGKNEITASTIPAGKQVSCMHTGPYSTLEPAYDAITAWINTNGHIATGIVYEFYLNDPDTTPANELLTKIVFFLK